ncbi:MAG TPA: hypothetical protein VM537_01945 [Anaerolineae bacterium]|jgi:hypothetical protein|nr:hypothetical protein [Anaerolineae bacterium]
MADRSIWNDKISRQAFIEKGKEVFEATRAELAEQEGAVVVAIEPETGECFVGKTLGEANRAAAEKHIDKWLYFVRVNDPESAIPLPAW